MQWLHLAYAARPLFLVLIVGIFLRIVWRAYSPRNKAQLQRHALIPFEDGQ